MKTNNTQLSKLTSVLLITILVTCSLLEDHVTGTSVSLEKRVIRRYPRARYRVGYMFGKRSSSTPTSSALFDIVSREPMSKKVLASLISKDPEALYEILTILDKNDDGYISASDLL